MKFKNKLYFGFGSIFLLTVFFLVFADMRMNVMQRDMNQIVNNQYQIVKQSTVIGDSLNKTSRALRDILIDPDANKLETYVNTMQKYTGDAFSAIEILTKTTDNTPMLKSVSDVKTLFQSYDNICQRVVVFARQGKKQEAANLIYKEAADIRMRLVNSVDQLKNIQEQEMQNALKQSAAAYQQTVAMLSASIFVLLLIGIGITGWVIVSTTRSLSKVITVITGVASNPSGELPRLEIAANDEIGEISAAFNEMAAALEQHTLIEHRYKQTMGEQNWLKTKIAEVSTMYQGIQDMTNFASMLMSKLVPLVGASCGAFYLRDAGEGKSHLSKLAAYANDGSVVGSPGFRLGDGLVGQCALENKTIVLGEVPEDYVKIKSGLGQSQPRWIMILPVAFEGQVDAVIELASLRPFTPLEEDLVNEVLTSIGVVLNRIKSHMQVAQLLKESQVLTEELQVQSEELQTQQEELRRTNEQLEEQYQNAEQKTRELEKAKADLEEKSQQLELTSKYKSEFLANMSHELRTPLNGVMVLSELLADNSEGNLTPEQTEFAQMIYSSGSDLLNLVNDILDLAKIESGKMGCQPTGLVLNELPKFIEKLVRPMAQQKGIAFEVILDSDLPGTLYTDDQKVKQILKNLLANAFKFTEQGNVRVHIHRPLVPEIHGKSTIAISVMDTGIGIAKRNQGIIFDAFQQADGTTSRKYGGTGLGLSISRELCELLGGSIEVESEEGRGSNFTLYLPEVYEEGISVPGPLNAMESATSLADELPGYSDDTSEGNAGGAICEVPENQLLERRKVLIVEDDIRNVFALTAALERQKMDVFCAENGVKGLELLNENPDIDLILMDIMMPEMDGYEAMRNIRQISGFKDLPIIALTAKAMKGDREKCLSAGATDYISKPVNLDQLLSLIRVWLYK